MSLRCGIVGLPNVGKSTLFNALTAAGIPAENYPFCTIEPNLGVVPVPDPRLAALDAIVHSERVMPAIVEFVDIAGLVAGASKGEGLGNQFLAHIRETDAILQVVRCFEDAGRRPRGGQAGSAGGRGDHRDRAGARRPRHARATRRPRAPRRPDRASRRRSRKPSCWTACSRTSPPASPREPSPCPRPRPRLPRAAPADREARALRRERRRGRAAQGQRADPRAGGVRQADGGGPRSGCARRSRRSSPSWRRTTAGPSSRTSASTRPVWIC